MGSILKIKLEKKKKGELYLATLKIATFKKTHTTISTN